LGLGSAITLLGMRYGSPEAIKFTEDVSRELAVAGWQEGLELAVNPEAAERMGVELPGTVVEQAAKTY